MSGKVAALAIAVCSFELAGTPDRVQIFPAGAFAARDGRPQDVASGQWLLDESIAQALLSRLAERDTDIVIDYEHQTMACEENGQPAPAAGWVKPASFAFDTDGLWALTPAWTVRARGFIEDLEYRYISPVFSYDRETGAVLDVLSIALTNNPAIDGMQALAAARRQSNLKEALMEKTDEELLVDLLRSLRWTLGLTEVATTADILAELEKVVARIRESAGTAATSLTAWMNETALAAASAKEPAAVDQSKYISLDAYDQLKAERDQLAGNNSQQSVDALIAGGLKDGRLHPTQEEWARNLGAGDIAALKEYIEKATPVAALTSLQTSGLKSPAPATVHQSGGLTPEAIAICRTMGLTAEEYLKTIAAKE